MKTKYNPSITKERMKEARKGGLYWKALQRDLKQGKFCGSNYESPTKEGEEVRDLYCPCGWCSKLHARMIAEKHTFNGKKEIIWVWKAPCLEKVEQEVLRKI